MIIKGCECGTTRNSIDSEEIRHYSKMSIFLILFGVSAAPISIDYKCKKCGQIFESLSKEEINTSH